MITSVLQFAYLHITFNLLIRVCSLEHCIRDLAAAYCRSYEGRLQGAKGGGGGRGAGVDLYTNVSTC